MDEPIEKLTGAEVLLAASFGVDGVNAGGDETFVLEAHAKNVEVALGGAKRGVDGVKSNGFVFIVEIIVDHHAVIHLLLGLNLIPIGEAVEASQ